MNECWIGTELACVELRALRVPAVGIAIVARRETGRFVRDVDRDAGGPGAAGVLQQCDQRIARGAVEQPADLGERGSADAGAHGGGQTKRGRHGGFPGRRGRSAPSSPSPSSLSSHWLAPVCTVDSHDVREATRAHLVACDQSLEQIGSVERFDIDRCTSPVVEPTGPGIERGDRGGDKVLNVTRHADEIVNGRSRGDE